MSRDLRENKIMNDIKVEMIHLSKESHWKQLISTKDCIKVNSGEKCMCPKIPDCFQNNDYHYQIYKEENIRRICFAPTIWQCIMSLANREGRLFIFRASALRPIIPSTVTDSNITGEFWITDSVIEDNGGAIDLECIGLVEDLQKPRAILRRFAL